MPRIDRKIKRERTRALIARNKREREREQHAFNLGMQMGQRIQRDKVNYSTLTMGYLYEYEVGTPEVEPVVGRFDSATHSSVSDPRYDYPDAEAIPA